MIGFLLAALMQMGPIPGPFVPLPITVVMTWQAADGATSYTVYRGSGACSSSPTMSVIGSSTNTFYSDVHPATGTYCYTVTAVNSAGESAYSNTAQAVIP
jgi:hypothetical protein